RVAAGFRDAHAARSRIRERVALHGEHALRGEVMDVRQRLTDGTARVRGGAIASVLLALVVACSQLVNLPRFVGLEDALSLSPSGGEFSRLTPITVTFPKAPADRTPDGQIGRAHV